MELQEVLLLESCGDISGTSKLGTLLWSCFEEDFIAVVCFVFEFGHRQVGSSVLHLLQRALARCEISLASRFEIPSIIVQWTRLHATNASSTVVQYA